MSLSNAVFDWGEAGPMLDTTHTITITATSPALSAPLTAIGGVSGSNGTPQGTPSPAPPASPPPGPIDLGAIPPAINVYAYPNADGGVNVDTYHDLGGGGFLALSLSIPAADDAIGTHAISNQVAGGYSTWTYEVYGQAYYSATGAENWTYVLSSASLMVSSAGHLSGETFTGQLTGAAFNYIDSTNSAIATLPLTISDSGTLSGTLSSSATAGGNDPGTAPWRTLADCSATH